MGRGGWGWHRGGCDFFPGGWLHFGGGGFFLFLGPPAPGAGSGPGLVDRVLFCQPAFPKFLKGNSRGNRGREMCRSGAEYVGEFAFFSGTPKTVPRSEFRRLWRFSKYGPRSMVQGANEEVLPRAISAYGPRGVVQGAWSKGHGPIGPYGPIVIGPMVLLLLGQRWSKGEWSKGAWSKYYSGGNCANLVICKL